MTHKNNRSLYELSYFGFSQEADLVIRIWVPFTYLRGDLQAHKGVRVKQRSRKSQKADQECTNKWVKAVGNGGSDLLETL